MNTINFNLAEKEIIDDICLNNKLKIKIIKRTDNKYTYIFNSSHAEIIFMKIQDIYVKYGFNENYKHNEFGDNCKNIIAKFNEIGW